MAAFAVILSITGIYFINLLTSTPDKILKDNYKSILAAQNMIYELDNMDNLVLTYIIITEKRNESEKHYEESKIKFLANLDTCKNNITEPGEKELINELIEVSAKYMAITLNKDEHTIYSYNTVIASQYGIVKQKCYDLLNLNHKGMLIRRDNMVEISEKAETYMLVISVLSVIIVMIAVFKVPSLVINPILEFTKKVQAITEKKYSERINIPGSNELGKLANSFNKMAAKLEEYDKTNIDLLIAEKRRAEAIVKSMVDGIFVLNENYEILIINNIGEELLGISADNLHGKNAFDIAKNNNLLNNLLQNLEESNQEANKRAQNYLRIFYKGKEEFYLKDVVKVTEGVKIVGFIVILKNVTGFKELDEQKSGFVATVSHELRTPLSAMNMSLRLLEDERIGKMNSEQRKIIESMKEEVKRLLKIVTELLNLSKMESGSDLLKLQHITAEELLDAALTPLLMQFEQKNVRINTQISENLPELNVDANKIAWVLINLLNNALRYSQDNSDIDLKVVKDNSNLIFSVRDHGLGIEPQHINKIFDKFVQLGGKNIENQKKGVGLGLAISKEFVNAHKGNIWVKSEPGKGSEFSFSIPV
jgi:PAS domain S-box-containing protein